MMDEPLGALDAEFRRIMCGELRAMHDRLKATTVYDSCKKIRQYKSLEHFHDSEERGDALVAGRSHPLQPRPDWGEAPGQEADQAPS